MAIIWTAHLVLPLTHICPEFFFSTKYPDTKSLPVVANGALLQNKQQGERLKHLFVEKRKSLFRGPCQQDAKITISESRLTKPVMHPEYGTLGVNGLTPIKVVWLGVTVSAFPGHSHDLNCVGGLSTPVQVKYFKLCMVIYSGFIDFFLLVPIHTWSGVWKRVKVIETGNGAFKSHCVC